MVWGAVLGPLGVRCACGDGGDCGRSIVVSCAAREAHGLTSTAALAHGSASGALAMFAMFSPEVMIFCFADVNSVLVAPCPPTISIHEGTISASSSSSSSSPSQHSSTAWFREYARSALLCQHYILLKSIIYVIFNPLVLKGLSLRITHNQ